MSDIVDFNDFDQSNPKFEPLSKKRVRIQEQKQDEEEEAEEEKYPIPPPIPPVEERNEWLDPPNASSSSSSSSDPPSNPRKVRKLFNTRSTTIISTVSTAPRSRFTTKRTQPVVVAPLEDGSEAAPYDLTSDYPYPYQATLEVLPSVIIFTTPYERAIYQFLLELSQAISHVSTVQEIFHCQNYVKFKHWEVQREKLRGKLPDEEYYYSDFFENIVFLQHVLKVKFVIQRALNILHFLPLCNQEELQDVDKAQLELAASTHLMDLMINTEMRALFISLIQNIYTDLQIDIGSKYKNDSGLERIFDEQATLLRQCATVLHPFARPDEVEGPPIHLTFAPAYNVIFPSWLHQTLSVEEQAYCHAAFSFVTLFQEACGQRFSNDYSLMRKESDFITEYIGGPAATAIRKTLATLKEKLHWRALSIPATWKKIIMVRELRVLLADVCAGAAISSKLLQGTQAVAQIVQRRLDRKLYEQTLLLLSQAALLP